MSIVWAKVLNALCEGSQPVKCKVRGRGEGRGPARRLTLFRKNEEKVQLEDLTLEPGVLAGGTRALVLPHAAAPGRVISRPAWHEAMSRSCACCSAVPVARAAQWALLH